MPLSNIVQIVLSSAVLGLILSTVFMYLAPIVGLMDDPKSAEHKLHHKPIPLVGGLSLILSLWIVSSYYEIAHLNPIRGIIISTSLIFIFGLWDDLKNLSPWIKLSGQIFAALLLVQFGVQVHLFDSPEFFFTPSEPWGNILNTGLTIFWIVSIVNAFNFIDSFDGLATGLASLSSLFFLIISLESGQSEMAVLCAIILGGTMAIYYLNSHPAKIFLGDSGSQMLGFILASIAILYQPHAVSQLSSWFVPIMIFSVPLFDICLVSFSRLRRKRKIHSASRDHTYHRLTERGLELERAVLLMHGVSLFISVIGFLCINLQAFWANAIFISFIAFAVYVFFLLDKNYE
ncbi:MAG: undecaprenyl/decaprenyl-phosphate alpha-N-acetylglucosaminyl 1-phosphate transferase [Candidatus Marinimicrobia bacterium]|nr:undecaprenyl/decaprenyl-phosphate alpha-N-acetylglucosaminyl 1-phosphate transferase [Candidatus Neomarinimicrobiota bacterium]